MKWVRWTLFALCLSLAYSTRPTHLRPLSSLINDYDATPVAEIDFIPFPHLFRIQPALYIDAKYAITTQGYNNAITIYSLCMCQLFARFLPFFSPTMQ